MKDLLSKSAEAARRINQQETERQARAKRQEAVDAIVEIQGKLYERSAAYMNLMLLGGYAGAFTIWSNTANNLSEKANVFIGLALGLSIAVFISFEVYKMVVTALNFMSLKKLIDPESSPDDFVNKTLALYRRETKPNPAFMPIWLVVIFVSVVSALVAFVLLFYNYMSILIGFPRWPA